MQRFLRLPSPAMAVAFLALFLVLSGSAVALKGRNKVLSDDIKNGQVKSADIKNNDVRGKDVRSNTLTGSDVAESKLGKVPEAANADSATSATNAANAANATNAGHANTADSADSADSAGDSELVSGQTVETYDIVVDPDDPSEKFESGGVELSFNCPSGNSSSNARNTSGEAAAFQSGWTSGATAHSLPDQDFTSGDGDSIGDTGSGAGTASVSFDDGTVTTIISAFQDDGQTTDGCHYWGRVISG